MVFDPSEGHACYMFTLIGIFSIRGLVSSVVGAVIILTVQGWLKKRKA